MNPDRFWQKVDRRDPVACWPWLASRCQGYGQVRVGRRMRAAHQIAYELTRGPIPAGRVLDHTCGDPGCVNPTHLEPVTHRTNLYRSPRYNGRKTNCPKGHPYDAVNTATYRGKRYCRTCGNGGRRPRWELKSLAPGLHRPKYDTLHRERS